MAIPLVLLEKGAADFGVHLTGEMLDQFVKYAALLLEWNEKINLTAITDPEEIVYKHFIDSLALLGKAALPEGARLIDVGTGAGFPGVPLKIVRPDLRVTLFDSLNKRLLFLRALCEELGLACEYVHARAEEAGRGALREAFDAVTARAVAALPALCEYCLPFAKLGGWFYAWKGPDCAEETAAAAGAIRLLGGGEEKYECFQLPDGNGRSLIEIKKIRPTPTKYPRQSTKITKSPLG